VTTLMRQGGTGDPEIIVARKSAMSGCGIRITRIPAEVFASLKPGELQLTLLPGSGHVNGGAPWDVDTQLVPIECRTPNTPL
jgi:hypothetical protein